MSNYLYIPLISWAAVAVIMIIIWLWALRIRNNGIVDIFWAFNFLVIAIIIWLLADWNPERKNLVCTIASIWSLRLGIYLLIRVGSHLNIEEGRYKQLREEWNNAKFFAFYQMQ